MSERIAEPHVKWEIVVSGRHFPTPSQIALNNDVTGQFCSCLGLVVGWGPALYCSPFWWSPRSKASQGEMLVLNIAGLGRGQLRMLPTMFFIRLLKKNLILIFEIIYLFYFTTLYWFCHTLTRIRHGCTCVPHPESPSHLPPHPIPLGHPSAPAPNTCLMHPTWTGDLFHVW